MKVKIRSFGSFRDILGKEMELDLASPSRVEDAMQMLRKEYPEFEKDFTDETLIVLNDRVVLRSNGKIEPKDLDERDILAIFPPVSGGRTNSRVFFTDPIWGKREESCMNRGIVWPLFSLLEGERWDVPPFPL